jgi:LuxR family maltose regulon positive regulatory protein
MTSYRISKLAFFGNFSMLIKGKPIRKKLGKKAKLLLAFLIYHHARPVGKEVLINHFWPHSTIDSARNCLNVTVHQVRKALQDCDADKEFILFEDDQYFCSRSLIVERDVSKFRKLWFRGQNVERSEGLEKAQAFYEEAIALYKGDFLNNALYEEWTDVHRENLKETYLAMLSKLSSISVKKKRFTQTISLCQKMLEKDDCLEEAHRLLMLSYEKLGMRDKAVKQYRKCKAVLRRELEVDPSQKTRDMYEMIRQ